MNAFVTACRREWRRLGVPEAVANEMASDLEADLAEAEADGASPEEVLGNGYFDPESFAASWATARGVVEGTPRPGVTGRRRPWVQLTATLVCAVAVLVGVVALAAGGHSSVSVAGVAFRRSAILRMPTAPAVPGVLVGPHQFFISHQGPAVTLFGAVLFLVGIVGLGITLWLWRPWSGRRRGSYSDHDIGMPSFL